MGTTYYCDNSRNCCLYFTFKLGFFQVIYLKHIFSETILKIIKKGNKAEGDGKGLITPFEAVSTAIGGSVGIGNIGGVATAMVVGIFLFGVTTSSGWYAYYEIILRHLMKSSPKLKDSILKFYRIFYPVPGFIMVVMATTIGMPGAKVWLFADFTTAIPTFINIAVILSLSGTFFKLFKDYKTRYILKQEVAEEDKIPVFYEDKNR